MIDIRLIGAETMKKTILLLLSVIMILCASACETDKQKLARLEREASEAERAANDTQSKLDRLTYLKEQLDRAKAKVDSCQKGTYEYELAVEEYNRIARQMISEFPDLEYTITP